jgi:hypothetical protein
VIAFLAVAAGCAVAAALARWSAVRGRPWVAPAVVLGATVIAVAVRGPFVGGGPLEGPVGYRNATAALYVQCVVASLMLIVAVRRPRLIVTAAAIIATSCFAAAAVVDAAAAVPSLIAVGCAVPSMIRPRWAPRSVVAAGALFLIVLVSTLTIGVLHRSMPMTPLAELVTERRLDLWSESVTFVLAHPAGAGIGRTGDVLPAARADPDARWAHHEFLQAGVTFGWPGLAAAIGLVVWGFRRLWVTARVANLAALSAASLAAVGIHACVDHVLHAPLVALSASALVGVGLNRSGSGKGDRVRNHRRKEDVEGGTHAVRLAGPATAG